MKIRPFDLDPDDDALYTEEKSGKVARHPPVKKRLPEILRKPHARVRRREPQDPLSDI